jgi:hypothetical protein
VFRDVLNAIHFVETDGIVKENGLKEDKIIFKLTNTIGAFYTNNEELFSINMNTLTPSIKMHNEALSIEKNNNDEIEFIYNNEAMLTFTKDGAKLGANQH